MNIIGRDSYGIYLWHVVPILIAKYLCVNDIGSLKFYLYSAVSSIGFILFYHYSSRLNFIRQNLYELKKQ